MPRRITPHLSEALAQYLAIRRTHCAPSTMANDSALLTKFVREVGDPRVHLLNQTDVESWFAQEAARQMPSSFNKVRMRVAGFLGFCTRRGWLTTDLLGEVRPRRVVQRERLRLSADQLRRLIESANPRDRAMLAVACNTGLRAGDLTALTVGDVDLAQGLLRVHVQKTGRLDFLPISSDLDLELRSWLTWYSARLARNGRVLDSAMLLTPALALRHRRDEYGDPQPEHRLAHPARVVHRALERIGVRVTSQEGFHTIRRSVGRLVFERASESGHDAALRITAALLGHSSTTVTEGYLGLSHDRVKRDDLLKGRSFLTNPQVRAPGLDQLSTRFNSQATGSDG